VTEPRIVRLADLPPAGRRIIAALLEAESAAARKRKAAPGPDKTPGAAATRTDHHAAST
jgi:hypothetical protein